MCYAPPCPRAVSTEYKQLHDVKLYYPMVKKSIIIKLLIIITVSSLSVLVFFLSKTMTFKNNQPEPPAVHTDNYIEIADLTVRLQGPGSYVCKAGFALSVDPENAVHIGREKYRSLLEDSIRKSISAFSYSDLLDRDGKIRLKQSIQDRLNKEIGYSIITDVYITNFILK